MTLHLRTNRHVRGTFPVVFDDATGWRRATASESIESDQEGFEYRGSIYATSEFDRAGDDIKRLGFDGVQAESYFSAVVITYWDREGYDLDGVIVGYIHW